MLNISHGDVVTQPFPHAVVDGILSPEMFAALRRDFPTLGTFAQSSGEARQVGSRVGSGLDIYRGDPEYEQLMRMSSSWRSFDSFINSEAFVKKFVDTFGSHLADWGCKIEDIPGSTFDRDFVEPRSELKAEATRWERVREWTRSRRGTKPPVRTTELFSRLDIEKSTSGYGKPPHCDRPNRVCSLIVYFTDSEASGLCGGELQIFRHKEAKPVTACERHPSPSSVELVSTISPRENLGVFFICCNNSYHGVTPIASTGVERDFLYINISSRHHLAW